MTFGDFDKVMARDGRVSFVFEACYAPNRPPIEEIANVLRDMLSRLRYETGEPVREVDMVAHSMGGLIVRAYLAGKQPKGGFATPALPRVRKVVFIGTPHFGTPVTSSTSDDPQLREMSLGSAFLFDLATWNQGADDLHGVEALSIAELVAQRPGDGQRRQGHQRFDGLHSDRPYGSAALLSYAGRNRKFISLPGAPGLALVTSEDHPTAQMVLAFLNGRDSWRSATDAAAESAVLGGAAGLMIQSRTADDAPRAIGSAPSCTTVAASRGSPSATPGSHMGKCCRPDRRA